MKPFFRTAAIAALLLSCVSGQEEKWTSIFNGKDLDGWTPKIRGFALGEDPKKTFIVEDGAIKVSYANYPEWGEAYGHLYYKAKLSNYKIRLEYRFMGDQVKGGPAWATQNSGMAELTRPSKDAAPCGSRPGTPEPTIPDNMLV